MDSLLFALNSVAPIILMVAIGYGLKRLGLMSGEFAKNANKLVFRVFLPAMLFLNVYRVESIGSIHPGYLIYGVAGLVAIFLLALPFVLLVTPKNDRRGALIQSAFRSNYALIGIPLAQSLFGEEGVKVAALLSAFAIPILNILAVISLSAFHPDNKKVRIKGILLNIFKNPLIESVMAGLLVLVLRSLFLQWGVEFRLSSVTSLFKVLEWLSNVATPMALLCLGAQFEFSAVAELKKEILFGTLMRTVAVPVLGLGIAYLFFYPRFGGAEFASFVALFATPVAVSSVPMTQEMKGDAVLAGQLVVWSTLVSGVTIFLYTFLLRLLGVF